MYMALRFQQKVAESRQKLSNEIFKKFPRMYLFGYDEKLCHIRSIFYLL
jgi:hypothetical protein